MKRIEIQLSKLKALQMVSAETVYVGGRSVGADDPSTYDKVFATDDDAQFLATMYDTAVTSLVTICGEWVDSVTASDDGSIITLALPDNLAPQGERVVSYSISTSNHNLWRIRRYFQAHYHPNHILIFNGML